MEHILQNILDRKLQDFKSARIKGQLCLSDELVNEVLRLSVKEMTSEVAKPAHSEAEGKPQPPDLPTILSYLNIEKLNYRTEASKTIIELSANLK